MSEEERGRGQEVPVLPAGLFVSVSGEEEPERRFCSRCFSGAGTLLHLSAREYELMTGLWTFVEVFELECPGNGDPQLTWTLSFIQSSVSGQCACTAVLECTVTLGTRLSRFSGFRQKRVRVRVCLCAHQPGHPPRCLFCGVFTVTFAYRKKGFPGCDFALLNRSSDGLTG